MATGGLTQAANPLMRSPNLKEVPTRTESARAEEGVGPTPIVEVSACFALEPRHAGTCVGLELVCSSPATCRDLLIRLGASNQYRLKSARRAHCRNNTPLRQREPARCRQPWTGAAPNDGRDDPRHAPPGTSSRAQDHPNPCDSGAVAAVLSGIRRHLGTAPTRRAAPRRFDLDPLARLLEPIRAEHARRPTRPCAAPARVRRRAQTLRARRTRRRRPRLRPAPRGHDPRLQDRPGAGRNPGGGAVRTRGKRCVPGPRAPCLHRGRWHPPRPGIPPDAPRRHPHQRGSQTKSVALIVKRRAADAGIRPEEIATLSATRSAPATRPRPRPSRSARSPTSLATRTSPFCAAISAPQARLTTSARCCSSARFTHRR